MDAFTLLLCLVGAFLVLGLASLGWGVDSRESMLDDHRR
jgi:hypothetical protein